MKNAICCFILLLPLFVFAQDKTQAPFIYVEQPDDPYIYVPREGRASSQPYQLRSAGFSIRQVNVNEAGQNILGDAANEPSLTIDPQNPGRMAIGWRQFDTIASNFRQAGFAFTSNGGENWVNSGPIEPGIFRSDPVLDTDEDGNFFYNSLSSSTGQFLCHVFKSAAGSNTWDGGVPAYGGDKQWMAIDRTDQSTNGNIYAFWKKGISSCDSGAFTRSLNNGVSYDACELFPGDPTRGTLTVSPLGELYACGGTNTSIQVLKSSNPGIEGQAIDWDFLLEVNMGGTMAVYQGPNPGGMLGQAWIDVDHSGGPTHGYVYMLATIANETDPANIIFVRSTDGGLSWSAPLLINDDNNNSNWQWFGSLSVAPNGRIDVTWLDTRDNPGTFLSRLYYSYSTDGGLSWSEDEALSEAFDPHLGWPQQQKIGDYYHQRSDNEGVHLAWAATFNAEEDVYYSYITPAEVTGTRSIDASGFSLTCAPNPFAESTSFIINIEHPAEVRIEITDAYGKLVARLSSHDLPPGDNTLTWHSHGAAPGLYYYKASVGTAFIGAGKVIKK